MIKKVSVLLLVVFLAAGISQAGVYIKYYNKDSKTHKFDVKIGESTRTVEFGSSRSAAVTIQGGGDKAEIKTDCGWVTIEDDSKIEIKDGCITVK